MSESLMFFWIFFLIDLRRTETEHARILLRNGKSICWHQNNNSQLSKIFRIFERWKNWKMDIDHIYEYSPTWERRVNLGWAIIFHFLKHYLKFVDFCSFLWQKFLIFVKFVVDCCHWCRSSVTTTGSRVSIQTV